MNPFTRTIILSMAIVLVAAFTPALGDLRFGPWVYWAPYYYPSSERLKDLGFKPQDFAPRYQGPHPVPPKAEPAFLPAMPPPPPQHRKIASGSRQRDQFRVPVGDRPSAGRPVTIRQPPVTRQPSPAPNRQVYTRQADKPRSVSGDPGSQRMVPARPRPTETR